MKKSILIFMCAILCLLVAGCSNDSTSGAGGQPGAQATQEPEATGDVPTLPPEETLVDVIAPGAYQYTKLELAGGNLSLDYPAHWQQIPGTKTICFIEPAQEGRVPARFTLTKKTLESAPNSDKKTSQIGSFLKKVVEGYDSYELSPLGTDGSFLGDNAAYYLTYTVQKEGVTLKGYVIMATRDKSLYVFHFRANVNDYESMGPVMAYIRDSITIK